MKIKNLFTLIAIFSAVLLWMSSSGGRATAANDGNTGAPGEGGLTCGICHNGGAGSYGTISEILSVTSGGSPVTTYVPGNTYTITLTLGTSMGTPGGYGFQMTALDGSESNAGTWQNLSSNVKSANASNVGGRTYLENNGVGASGTFTMEWVAPTAGTGNVSFYFAGNAVNGTGGTNGDVGSTGSAIILTEAPLPVELVSFEGIANKEGNLLTWETATEINNERFEVESSTDGQEFITIGTVRGSGNSSEAIKYSFLDKELLSSTYYRLKQVDFDGAFEYSDIIKVTRRKGFEIASVFPNPTRGQITLVLESTINKQMDVSIVNLLGKQVEYLSVDLDNNANYIDVDMSSFPSGVYYIILDDGVEKSTQKVIKK